MDLSVKDLSLLFPVREGRFTVFHKTVIDWLSDPARDTEDFHISAKDNEGGGPNEVSECMPEAAGR